MWAGSIGLVYAAPNVQTEAQLKNELYQTTMESMASILFQNPQFASTISASDCKKLVQNKQKIENMSQNIYDEYAGLCSIYGTPAFSLLTSNNNTISGKLKSPVHYGTDSSSVANFLYPTGNFLVDIKINGQTAAGCQASLHVAPDAMDLNKDPQATIAIYNVKCSNDNVKMIQVGSEQFLQKITLTCSRYRFNSVFMRKYLPFINKCEEYSMPQDIELNTGTFFFAGNRFMID